MFPLGSGSCAPACLDRAATATVEHGRHTLSFCERPPDDSALHLDFGGVGAVARLRTRGPPAPLVTIFAEPVDFLKDVNPVLDSRCVVCHSGFNVTCQLKPGSYEGVDRGGSKDAVYS